MVIGIGLVYRNTRRTTTAKARQHATVAQLLESRVLEARFVHQWLDGNCHGSGRKGNNLVGDDLNLGYSVGRVWNNLGRPP
jgi:hypothetical protein